MACRNCLKEVGSNSPYCGYCGFPQNDALFSSQFDQANEQFSERKRKFDDGRITKEEFVASVKEIKLTDRSNRIWSINPDTGKWQRSQQIIGYSGSRYPRVLLPVVGTAVVIVTLLILVALFGSVQFLSLLGAPSMTPQTSTPLIITRIITSIIEGPKSTPMIVTMPVTVVVYPPTLAPLQVTKVVPRPETVVVNAPTQPPIIIQITTTPPPIRIGKYSRSSLISPQNGTKIANRYGSITLQWQLVGNLVPEEVYLVQVSRDVNFDESQIACTFKSRADHVTLPPELGKPCNSWWSYNNTFFWRVSVVYQDSKGDFQESNYSAVWSFGWNP